MSSLITVLYGVAALTGATFAAVEFRMLWRFLRHRREIRATVTSSLSAGSRLAIQAPTITIR